MKIIACPACHTQFDATTLTETSFRCPCGLPVENRSFDPVEAEVRRCGSCGASVERTAERCGWCGSELIRDLRRLSLVCPECYARNDEKGRFCTACGVAFRPQVIPGPAGARRCPVCDLALLGRTVAGFVLQECPECHGLWAVGETLDELLERIVDRKADGPAAPEGTRKPAFQSRVVYRRCPDCGQAMQRRNFAGRSGVIVDWCGSHGTWLDADELEALAAYLATRGRESRGDPGPGDWRLPADEKRVHARYTAEKLMAGERMKSERRLRRLRGEPDEGGLTLGGLLDDLLK